MNFENAPNNLPTPPSIHGLDLMMLRVNQERKIVYLNTVCANKLKIDRRSLLGQPVEQLYRLLPREFSKALDHPFDGLQTNRTITLPDARVLNLTLSKHESGTDIVIDDITEDHRWKSQARKYISFDPDQLDEEARRTFEYPERRFMSVSFCDVRGFTQICESHSPEKVRELMNAFLNTVINEVESHDGMIDKIVGDEVMALFGAPRYFPDHAFRAVITACQQVEALSEVRATLAREGKQLPSCGIGINTGDMVLGNMGSDTRQDYTVLGAAVNLASRLCEAASEDQVLITEATMQEILSTLPEGWEAYTYHETDFSLPEDKKSNVTNITELKDDMHGRTTIIGPNVSTNRENAQYRFHYLYALKARNFSHQIPVIEATIVSTRQKAEMPLADASAYNPQVAERIFGKYRLLHLIGRGGMGEVWKARDHFGNTVAIKMLLAGGAASQAQLDHFRREAHIMSKLSHRNICRIFELGEMDNITYIVMEYINGASLSDILRQGKSFADSRIVKKRPGGSRKVIKSSYTASLPNFPDLIESVREKSQSPPERPTEINSMAELAAFNDAETQSLDEAIEQIADSNGPLWIPPLQQTLAILNRLCEALQFAHEHGVYHRDLKPANIMLRPDGEPVVMDFGLAKMEIDGQQSVSYADEIMGTIDFMAPEQAMDAAKVDERADVYSVGAIIYLMLTGHDHFLSSNNLLLDAQRLQEHEPKRPSKHNKLIDHDLETITLKALRCDPDERYRNIQALHDDLRRFQAGEPISARDVGVTELMAKNLKRHKRAAIFIGLTAIFLIGELSIFLYWQSEQIKETQFINAELKSANQRLKREQTKAEDAEHERAIARQRQEQLLRQHKLAAEREKLRLGLEAKALEIYLEGREHLARVDGEAQAITSFTEALRIHRDLIDAYRQRALAYQALNQYDEALKDLLEANAIKRRLTQAQDTEALRLIGDLYRDRSDDKQSTKEAISYYDRAAAMEEQNVDVQIAKVAMLLLKKELELAHQTVNDGIKAFPNRWELHAYKGLILSSPEFKMDRPAKYIHALVSFSHAIKLKVDRAELYLHRARLNYEFMPNNHEQRQSILEDLGMAITFKPNELAYRQLRIEMATAFSNFLLVESDARFLIAQQPNNASNHVALINALIAQRQLQSARNQLKLARNSFPNNSKLIQLERYLSQINR